VVAYGKDDSCHRKFAIKKENSKNRINPAMSKKTNAIIRKKEKNLLMELVEGEDLRLRRRN